MLRRPPSTPRTDILFPYTTLFRSDRGMHAVDILGAGLDPDQDHFLALGGAVLRLVGGEHRLAGGRPRRGRQAAGDHPALGLGIEHGMQELVERSEEHTSELQSLMRISYAVFCLKKKNRAINT